MLGLYSVNVVILLSEHELGLEYVAAMDTNNAPQASNCSSHTLCLGVEACLLESVSQRLLNQQF